MDDGDDGDPPGEPRMGTGRRIPPLHGRRLLVCGQIIKSQSKSLHHPIVISTVALYYGNNILV